MGWKYDIQGSGQPGVPAVAGAEAERGRAAIAQDEPAVPVARPGGLAVDDVLDPGQALRRAASAPAPPAAGAGPVVRCAETHCGSPA